MYQESGKKKGNEKMKKTAESSITIKSNITKNIHYSLTKQSLKHGDHDDINRLEPHSQQNLALDTGNLLPHS